MTRDALSTKATLTTTSGTASYVSLRKLAAQTGTDIGRLPHTIKILAGEYCPKSWQSRRL